MGNSRNDRNLAFLRYELVSKAWPFRTLWEIHARELG